MSSFHRSNILDSEYPIEDKPSQHLRLDLPDNPTRTFKEPKNTKPSNRVPKQRLKGKPAQPDQAQKGWDHDPFQQPAMNQVTRWKKGDPRHRTGPAQKGAPPTKPLKGPAQRRSARNKDPNTIGRS